MNANPLDALLEKLCGGDAQAAEQVFLAYEPYLRMVVRRQLPARLRGKFDSIDVVQSVWADLLEGFQEADWSFNSADQLRAFLVKVTRNRFIDHLRHHRNTLDREIPLEEPTSERGFPSTQPRPSEVAQADELWQQMLALCPPAHHELLRLRRDGKTLTEIAEETGMHPSSVRRILYDLSRGLAARNSQEPASE